MRHVGESIANMDPRELRNAFGLFPTGVAIVTAFSGSERIGMTVSSFNTVSLDPPLILFSILNSAKTFSQWMAAEEFCVNFLGEEQSELSNRFARPLTDKWKDVGWDRGQSCNVPVLDGCPANFECSTWERYPGGDHTIIVGRIAYYRQENGNDRRPLVFCGGKYRKIESDIDLAAPPYSHEWLLGW
jgi:flavin reductase (DIM6/NTAB) family NADH-FMN oxidoreductase RutF